MDDPEALYDAVLREPAEDTPRLVYADALDERASPGDAARAAFIRKQIERDRIGPPPPKLSIESNFVDSVEARSAIHSDVAYPVGTLIDVEVRPTDGSKTRLHNRTYLFSNMVVKKAEGGFPSGHVLHLDKAGPDRRYDRARAAELDKELLALVPPKGGPAVMALWSCPPPKGPLLAEFWGPQESPRRRLPWLKFTPDAFEAFVGYARGFPSALALTYDRWRKCGDELVNLLPLDRVRLYDLPAFDTRPLKFPDEYEYTFRGLGFHTAVEVKFPAYQRDLEGRGEGEADRNVADRILRKRWPSVTTWDLPDFAPEDAGYELVNDFDWWAHSAVDIPGAPG